MKQNGVTVSERLDPEKCLLIKSFFLFVFIEKKLVASAPQKDFRNFRELFLC